MNKKVLYLSYDGMTDPLGQSQVLPYLKGLSQAGYEIHLVSYEKTHRFLDYKRHIQDICDSANIVWHPQDYNLGGGILNTIRQVRRMRKIAFYLNDKYGYDIVHCRSYISALAGLRLKRKKGVKFIFDMRGFWADERVDGKLWSLSNPLFKIIYKYFKGKEIQFFKEADYTVSLTEKGKEEIVSWSQIDENKIDIEVIPCCADLDLFDSKTITTEQLTSLRKELNINDSDYVLGYIGSIGTWYMLSEMLDFFTVLKKEKPSARFLFVTGEDRTNIVRLAKSKGINEEDIIVRSVLHIEVPKYISLFDRSIFFIRSTFSKKASSPTKQGEIMAMGVPLYCNAGIGDTDRIVEKYHSGIPVESFSEESYLKAIRDTKEFNKAEIIEGAKDYFSLKEGVKRYLKVYEHVCK